VPEQHHRVCAPRTPCLRSLRHGARRRVERQPLERATNAEIGRDERVGISQRAHPNVLRRPRPDPVDPQERRCRLVRIALAAQVEITARDQLSHPPDRARAARGDPELLEWRVDQPLRLREEHRDDAIRSRQRLAEARCDAAEHRSGPGDRDLLSGDRPHRQLEAVGRSRDSHAEVAADEWAKGRVAGERPDDGIRVGVKIEEPARDRDRR